MTVPETFYEDQLRPIFSAHDWLVAFDAAPPCLSVAASIRDKLGARSVRALAASRGTGDLAADVEHRILGVQADSMMSSIRASEDALDAPPRAILDWLDDWDPGREARVIRPLFSKGQPIGGRRSWGARDPRWQALEDKTVIDAVWDAVGVPRAPSRTVSVDAESLAAAARDLDRGHGTVWAGDNTSGWHGGASFTRWVETDDEAAEALALFSGACQTARVMPFIEGVPCSIHGIVFDDDVRALRPCEMIVLRGTGRLKLAYAAASTFWDPAPDDRDVMRETARNVGRHLRETLGYRGVFTIDGVMGVDGFMPTELNPRYGAAIGVMTRGMPHLPMYLLHCAMVEGEALDWRPAELERLIVAQADGHREGRAGMICHVRRDDQVKASLIWADGGFQEAAEDEEPHATLSLGPAAAGSYLHVNFSPAHTPVGPALGPRAAQALIWADQRYGLGLGPLGGAPSVR